MTQPPVPPTPAPPPTPPPPPPPTTDEKMLPQSQVNAIVAAETRQAREKAERDLAESLGVSVDEAKRIVGEAQARAEGEKTEAQRARDAADKERNEAAAEKAETLRERYELHAASALLKAGAPNDDAKLARLTGLLETRPGATKEDIAADVVKVKKDFPELFKIASDTPPPPPHSDPSGRPPAPGANGDMMAAGMARAQQRYPKDRQGIPVPGLSFNRD